MQTPPTCRNDDAAGNLTDDALSILARDLRPAVELAEQDKGRALALLAVAVQVNEVLTLWREIDALVATVVVNRFESNERSSGGSVAD